MDAILNARDDEEVASLPPSSPRDRDGNSSEYSSDDGNVAGGEETDVGHRCATESDGIRRRATVHEVGQVFSKPVKGRSLSLSQCEHSPTPYRKSARSIDSSTASKTRCGGQLLHEIALTLVIQAASRIVTLFTYHISPVLFIAFTPCYAPSIKKGV